MVRQVGRGAVADGGEQPRVDHGGASAEQRGAGQAGGERCAWAILTRQGRAALRLEDGFPEWRNAGLPEQTGFRRTRTQTSLLAREGGDCAREQHQPQHGDHGDLRAQPHRVAEHGDPQARGRGM